MNRTIVSVVALLLASFIPLQAGEVAVLPTGNGTISLQWDPVPGAEGYKIHYGLESGQYQNVLDIGPNTQGTVDGLEACVTYYAAVTAYNAAGDSPQFSNEIAGWARPDVQTNDKSLMTQGGQYTINITGENFSPGAELIFDIVDAEGAPLVHVDSIQVLSCNELQALVTVEPTAAGFRAMEVGTHELIVRNADGVVGASSYEVVFNETRLDINRSSADTVDRVNGKDLVWLAYAHGTSEGEDRFNADADLNGDGFIGGEDLAYLATSFGSCWNGADWTSCP